MKASSLFTTWEINQYEVYITAEKAKAYEKLEKAKEEGNIAQEYAIENRLDELDMAWRVLQAYKG